MTRVFSFVFVVGIRENQAAGARRQNNLEFPLLGLTQST